MSHLGFRVLVLMMMIFFYGQQCAQRSELMTNSQLGDIKVLERKMQRIGQNFLKDSSQDLRISAARKFVKALVQALKIENSFQYNFDSIPYLAKVSPEDSSFKIYTFQVVLDNYTFVHYGCIQFNEKKLKLLPLRDFSDTFPITPQSTLSNKNWLGAVYYGIVTKTIKNKKVYFLFGFDQNDILSNKKYIEPMWLEGDREAKFGMPVFNKTYFETYAQPKQKFMSAKPKEIPPKRVSKVYHRYVLEYRMGANVSMRYNKERDLIIHDHTPPLDGKTKDIGFIKVPDGTYEGLQWNEDTETWNWVDYMRLSETETNEPIRPVPTKDKKLMPK